MIGFASSKDTLVPLSMIRLLEGEWSDILERMQQVLTLNEIHFSSDLLGDDPKQYWSFEPPDCFRISKDDSVRQNRLRWALEAFMLEGGMCPLRVFEHE